MENKLIQFKNLITLWGSAEFDDSLKKEILALNGKQLPLQKGLSYSSVALDDKFDVMVLNVSDIENNICVKAGIFYTGIIAGCSCSDDPSPTDLQNEYCEVLFTIDKFTGLASVDLFIGSD